MNRILLMAGILAGLGLLVALLVFRRNDSSFSVSETAFAIEDTAAVQRIYLADLSDRSITLERSKGMWNVNGKWRARPDAVEQLLTTMHDIRVNRPVPRSQHNMVVRELAGEHTKVEAWDRRGKRMVSYYIGSTPKNYRGNYMKLESGKQPFVVQIPGFDGFLHTRYFLDEIDWRDRTIFATPVEQIASVSVRYTFKPDSSWSLLRADDGTFSVQPFRGQAPSRPVNARAATSYLQAFGFMAAESYENEYPMRDSVLLSQPVVTISLSDRSGTSTDCYLYYRPLTKRDKSQFDLQGKPLVTSREKYFASINDGEDFVLVQDFVFGKLFVGWGYFFQSEPRAAIGR